MNTPVNLLFYSFQSHEPGFHGVCEVLLFLSTGPAEHRLKNVINTIEFKFTSTTFYLFDFGKSLSVS